MPEGAQVRFKGRAENAFSFIKAGLTKLDNSCWAEDGFLSVSCTTSSPSNCWKRRALIRSVTGTPDPGDTKLLTVDDDCHTELGLGPVVCAHTTNQIHVSCEIGDCIQYFPCSTGSSWSSLECRCVPTPTPTTCIPDDGGGPAAHARPGRIARVFASPASGACQQPDYLLYPYDDGCNVSSNYFPSGGCCCQISPILIDLSGDGFNLTNGANGVLFDIMGTGRPLHISWTSAQSDDAWLVLDRNGNGTVDSGAELFGNLTPQQPPADKARNGFLALAEFDKVGSGGNLDGVIDSQDSVFSRLRLWQDRNHNGISEPSELKRLAEMGIEKLELEYQESKRVDEYGNQFRYRAKVRDAHDGQVGRWAWDVFLISAH